jgi:hypothetical protein
MCMVVWFHYQPQSVLYEIFWKICFLVPYWIYLKSDEIWRHNTRITKIQESDGLDLVRVKYESPEHVIYSQTGWRNSLIWWLPFIRLKEKQFRLKSRFPSVRTTPGTHGLKYQPREWILWLRVLVVYEVTSRQSCVSMSVTFLATLKLLCCIRTFVNSVRTAASLIVVTIRVLLYPPTSCISHHYHI